MQEGRVMFRESEIIGMLNDITKKLNVVMSKPEGDVFGKLENILEHCEDLKHKLDVIEEECLRDDEEFRFQIRLAVKEYMVEQIPKKKKETKKVEKKVSKKK